MEYPLNFICNINIMSWSFLSAYSLYDMYFIILYAYHDMCI